MNREAILRILDRTRQTGSVALADPPTPAPWDVLTHSPDPRLRLLAYLNTWAGMDEAAWPEANVRALYEDIMDLFKSHPEADAWYRDWRTAHPEARW